MALSPAVVREHAEGLNAFFTAQQAQVILALVNAAASLPPPPAGAGEYNLLITAGVPSWIVDGTH